MVSLPMLKFEKSNQYLNNQLIVQENNKQLITDVIDNLRSAFETASKHNKKYTSSLLNSPNIYLKNISKNITKIEQLVSEINNIDKRLSELISENTNSKTKEFYIEELNTIKHDVESYFKKFKSIEKKLLSDNEKLNNFLKDNNVNDNETLLISEKLQKIYIPYKLSEVVNHIENNPNAYNSIKEVVEQKFTLPFDYFYKHPSKSRFSESYNLLRKDGNNFIKSVSYSFKLLTKRDLNPAIIACCKNKKELDEYLECLDSNNLENFKYFKVIYDINPF